LAARGTRSIRTRSEYTADGRLRIIRSLAVFNCLIIVAMGAYAYYHAMPSTEMIPLLLTSVLAIIPVALPATFTLAAAIALVLSPSRRVANTAFSRDEAASIDVLCSDKPEL